MSVQKKKKVNRKIKIVNKKKGKRKGKEEVEHVRRVWKSLET